MATIKMDVTEYQEMQKVAELLKESVKREEEFRKTIQTMQAEKIDILEQNEKTVTIRKEVQTYETRSVMVSGSEFRRNLVFLADDVRIKDNTWGPDNDSLSYARDAFERMFKTHTSHNRPTVTTSYKGLEELTDEIEKNYNDKQDKDIKDKLEHAAFTMAANEELAFNNDTLGRKLDVYVAEVKELREENKALIENSKEYAKEIKEAAYKYVNMLNYSEFKVNIIKIVKKHE